MKIIIVEDELIWQEKLREYLLKFSLESKIEYKISIYNDGDSFLKDYKNDADLKQKLAKRLQAVLSKETEA